MFCHRAKLVFLVVYVTTGTLCYHMGSNLSQQSWWSRSSRSNHHRQYTRPTSAPPTLRTSASGSGPVGAGQIEQVATTSNYGQCSCHCQAPKVVHVEVPKYQVKYVPVSVKGTEDDPSNSNLVNKEQSTSHEPASGQSYDGGAAELGPQRYDLEDIDEQPYQPLAIDEGGGFAGQSSSVRRTHKPSAYGLRYV